MKTRWQKYSLLAAAGLVSGGVAWADGDEETDTYAWRDGHLKSEIGVGISIGGGVSGFTDQAVRNATTSNASGLWSVRAVFGTHIPLALELGYLGTAVDIHGQNMQPTLLGTTTEGALRFNVLPHEAWNPYVFGGLGWQRYDIVNGNASATVAGLRSSDDAVEIPMGAGLAFRDPSGITVDVRGTFRAVMSSDLVPTSDGGHADLHTWDATGAVGYEF